VRRRPAGLQSEAPPRGLIWPFFDDLLAGDEIERVRGELDANGYSVTEYEAIKRLHAARRAWVAERNPGLSDVEVAVLARKVFATHVPGRRDLPPRPLLPTWRDH
jgi:hypothetical protein